MRYLTISVWPLCDANIKALHPSWNEKNKNKTWNYSCHYLFLNKSTFLITYIQQITIIKSIIIFRILCTIYLPQDFMHNIPASVNPVTPLLQWDIWQSLYGHCVMPTLKHSIHSETRKQNTELFMSLPFSQQKHILDNYIQQLTIIKTWCSIYHHHQDFMHNIPVSVNPVTPLLQWDIWQSLYGHRVMPTLKHSIHPEMRKQNTELFMSLPFSQQKHILDNYIQQLTIIKTWCSIYHHHQDFMHNISWL